MPRTATQKANRRLRRQMRPTFPFTKLPAELQLLVRLTNIHRSPKILCKCDFVSIGRLLQLSPYARGLFLCYPETVLQGILAQLPPPIASLLRVSWALHNVSDATFDSAKTLDVLRNTDLLQWHLRYPRVLANNDDPLETLEGLIDVSTEVNTAVELVAHGMHTAMDAFVNPHVVATPVVLSPTEHTRIACSLYIIKIYYQLRLKFPHHGHGRSSEFPATFLRGLRPWQVESAVSVEYFFEACKHHGHHTMYTVIDKRYTSLEYLSEKSLYFRNYLKITDSFAVPLGLSRAAVVWRQHRQPQPPWTVDPADPCHPSGVSQVITQLRNHGWLIYTSITGDHRVPRLTYARWYLSIGLLFWDHDRLIHWNLTDTADLTAAYAEFDLRQEVINSDEERLWPPYRYGYRHSALVEKVKTRQVVEWTRCEVQCSLEERLYQTTALGRIADGRPALPAKYIVPGFVCYVCGVDGHAGNKCDEGNWSDEEEGCGGMAKSGFS